MPEYRIYIIGSDDRIAEPPLEMTFALEEEALMEATFVASSGKRAEVWAGGRLLHQLSGTLAR